MQETWEERILKRLTEFPGQTDRDLREYFKVSNQRINGPCLRMEKKGLLVRQVNPEKDGMIGNYPTGKVPPKAEPKKNTAFDGEDLQEEDIKKILTDTLKNDGWEVQTAWGHAPGVDIDARRGKERWLIEVKGPGSRQPMRVNYFIGILGETLQRMDDPNARYTIALPDMAQYRGLWDRLPRLAKERTGIDLLLIDKNGNIENIK